MWERNVDYLKWPIPWYWSYFGSTDLFKYVNVNLHAYMYDVHCIAVCSCGCSLKSHRNCMLVCGWPLSLPVYCHINSWGSWLVRNSVWHVTTFLMCCFFVFFYTQVSNFHFFQGSMLASNSSSSTSSSKAAPNWGTSTTHPTLYGPTYPQTRSSKSVTTPHWADGWVKLFACATPLFQFQKACKILILIPFCLFVGKNLSVMTENER